MRALTSCVCGLLITCACFADSVPSDVEFFEKHVRPVLAEHCLSCHGPKKQMSGLRLDTRESLLAGGDNGPAIKPGDPDASELIRAVRQTGERKMPPKGKLTRAQVDALANWVRKGAPWPRPQTTSTDTDAWKRHWAFQPVRRPPLPQVKQRDWPRTSVDPFVLARLEDKGLAPSPEADRAVLLRRVTFDLTGLPPTPEEVRAFVDDLRPDAYERVVARLLSSPHYGERWGRHWLDVARYADTKGYVFFEESNYPWAWTYRDYVVGAFNADLPYDRFVLEQLAADRLPEAERRSLTAMGFVTAGGRFMNNVHDILDDRIDVTTRGLMGLTVSCARCHDHKFDPVPTADYYSLHGVFASSVEPDVPPLFADPPKTPAYEAFTKEQVVREKKLAAFMEAKRDEVRKSAKKRVAEYLLAVHAMRDQPDTEEFMLLADGNDINPAMLKRWRSYLSRARRDANPALLPWHELADLPAADFAARAPRVLEGLAGRGNPLVLKALRDKPPQSLADVARHYSDLLNSIDAKWEGLRGKATVLPDAAEEGLRQVFHGPVSPPNVTAALFNDLSLLPDRPAQAELQKLRKAVEEWRATGPGAPPRAMALEDMPVPVEPRILVRGNPGNPGPAVPRRYLGFLSARDRQPFRDGSGRLELARAIASRDNPLTARVFVNRVWMHHFGRPLVATPGDFGQRSEPPSHPDLLDHLASGFMADGWSVKRLHRQIVLSAAYRQSGADRPDARRVDPENVLLWRAHRRRLDFESLRDGLLAVSGRLDRKAGGPPVKDLLSTSANRRTLYCFLDRLNVPGLLRTFDFPSPDATSAERPTTTVPQQALFLMNSPFVLDCARRVLARPDVAAIKDEPGKVDRIYRLLLARPPSDQERALAREFLATAGAVSWERYVQALLLTNEFAFID